MGCSSWQGCEIDLDQFTTKPRASNRDTAFFAKQAASSFVAAKIRLLSVYVILSGNLAVSTMLSLGT